MELFQRKRFRVTMSSVDPDSLTDDALAKLPTFDGIVLTGGFTAEHRERISSLVGPTISILANVNPEKPQEDELADYNPLVSPERAGVLRAKCL